jgi:hypothetical protein
MHSYDFYRLNLNEQQQQQLSLAIGTKGFTYILLKVVFFFLGFILSLFL